jgi:hypothetical protein
MLESKDEEIAALNAQLLKTEAAVSSLRLKQVFIFHFFYLFIYLFIFCRNRPKKPGVWNSGNRV